MAKKILSIIDTAYRATLEEQDDTTLWFSAACKNAGADLTLLLTGNAVNYSVKDQKPSALTFGKAEIPHPPQPQEDLKKLIEKGVGVFLMKEDAEERAIPSDSMIQGIKPIARNQLSKLIDQYDLIWHW
jgi:predicted peroxiredoxin